MPKYKTIRRNRYICCMNERHDYLIIARKAMQIQATARFACKKGVRQ